MFLWLALGAGVEDADQILDLMADAKVSFPRALVSNAAFSLDGQATSFTAHPYRRQETCAARHKPMPH